MTLKRKLLLAFGLSVLCASISYAQPGGGGPGGGPPIPITGIEILIGAGALLGAKRLVDHKKIKK